MAEPEVFAVPSADAEPEAAPHVSLVVPIYNEEASVDELYRRTIETLESRRPDVRADLRRRRLDGRDVREARARCTTPTRACVPCASSATSASIPAMHAGLARARGDILVTMDGDLQNAPEDIPKLVRAVEDRLRRRERAARRAAGLVGPDAAEPADQRHAPALHARRHLRLRLRVQRVPPLGGRADARRDRQAEVHEGAGPLRRCERRRGRRRARAARRTVALLAASPDPARAARARRVLAAADPVDRDRARRRLHVPRARRSAIYGVWCWVDRENFPGPLLGGVAVLFVLGIQGFILALVGEYLARIQRDVEGRPLYTIEREL